MVGNTGADFFARYSLRYNSPKTKYNVYIVTVSNGLSRIVGVTWALKGHKHEIFFTVLQKPKPYDHKGLQHEIFENRIQLAEIFDF
jgi:hypothetical protein